MSNASLRVASTKHLRWTLRLQPSPPVETLIAGEQAHRCIGDRRTAQCVIAAFMAVPSRAGPAVDGVMASPEPCWQLLLLVSFQHNVNNNQPLFGYRWCSWCL